MPDRVAATAGQTIGPYLHCALAYDGSNELVPPGTAHAVRLLGTVYDGAGDPIPDALVEIRQADASGGVPSVAGSLHRDGTFTGWGRAATDAAGHYWFRTREPGPLGDRKAAFFAMTVFARGLLDRRFTRAYLPGPAIDTDPLLSRLTPNQRETLLVVRRDDERLCFDIRLQGDGETVFLSFPGHGG